MAITAEMVKKLRDKTGAGMMDCKRALAETEGDFDKAIDLLRQKGLAVAAKRESKIASEGIITSYIHTGGKIGVLVELNCETDFVARTDEFKELGHDLAMHIAWSNPSYVRREEIPESLMEREREIHHQWAINEGKPPQAIDKIVDGKMESFYSTNCLLDQPFVKDNDMSVNDRITEAMGKLGEKIAVGRFVRLRVGELESLA
jgi:elongation factor Ts